MGAKIFLNTVPTCGDKTTRFVKCRVSHKARNPRKNKVAQKWLKSRFRGNSRKRSKVGPKVGFLVEGKRKPYFRTFDLFWECPRNLFLSYFCSTFRRFPMEPFLETLCQEWPRQTKERSVHELLAGAFRNKNSVKISESTCHGLTWLKSKDVRQCQGLCIQYSDHYLPSLHHLSKSDFRHHLILPVFISLPSLDLCFTPLLSLSSSRVILVF